MKSKDNIVVRARKWADATGGRKHVPTCARLLRHMQRRRIKRHNWSTRRYIKHLRPKSKSFTDDQLAYIWGL